MQESTSFVPLPLELSEMECLGLKPLLESNGIEVLVSGPSQLPNLPWQLQVPDRLVADALRVIREARIAGPEAAEAAELAGESNGDQPPTA